MNLNYQKGRYYRRLGYYLELRETYTNDNKILTEHLFTDEKDRQGVAILNRVLVSTEER
jgi:hypothetical protein